MNSPVYTFGPHAHPSAALSLRDALVDTFPSFSFDVEMMSTSSGFREAVVLRGPTNTKAWERMVMFAQGFVAGFGGGVQPPTRAQAIQRTLTRADCPVAKRKSEPPPAPPSTPTLPSQPAPRVGVVSIPMPRRPTLTGLPLPRVG